MSIQHRRMRVGSVAAAGALSLTLTACGSGDDSAGGGASGEESPDVQAALEEGGELTVWAWEPTLTQVVDDFEKKYPNVDVELANVGTSEDQYTALQNALSAGDGIPDVAQIDYYALPQFAVGEALADLTPYGAQEFDGTFIQGGWDAVHQQDAIYGLPMASGPMALFYNKAVFDEHDVEVPTTWDEYYEAGIKLQEADPDVYITADKGDPGLTTSMIWQAGGQPYTVEGTDVQIDLAGEGSQKFATHWQKMIDDGVLADVSPWTDEWFQSLANGTIATLPTGAWMPPNLESGAAAASGDWRVAPLPQWEEGERANAENGGGALSVMEASENRDLAYGFLEYANVGEGVQTRVDQGSFPATTAELNSEEYLNQEPEYFGGQKINKVLAQAAEDVLPGWQFLPFQSYANSIYSDTVGKAYIDGSTSVMDGLQSWQDASVKYGNDQGFSVQE